MTVRPFRHAQPVVAASSGTVEERLVLLAEAINRKADANAQSVFTSVVLIAPDKTRWEVSVTATGSLTTVQLS